MSVGGSAVRVFFDGKEMLGVEAVEFKGMRERQKYVVGLSLAPASTSCRPPCGQVVMAECEWPDGASAGQLSMGCRCRTSPLLLIDLFSVYTLRVRSQSCGPSSCSVSDDSGRGHADFGA